MCGVWCVFFGRFEWVVASELVVPAIDGGWVLSCFLYCGIRSHDEHLLALGWHGSGRRHDRLSCDVFVYPCAWRGWSS